MAAPRGAGDDPDDTFLDQVEATGERAPRHLLADEAARLHHADQQAALDASS